MCYCFFPPRDSLRSRPSSSSSISWLQSLKLKHHHPVPVLSTAVRWVTIIELMVWCDCQSSDSVPAEKLRHHLQRKHGVLEYLTCPRPLMQTHTHTQTRALALLLTSDVHLGHYRRRDGGEIEREETKGGREGKGISGYTADPSRLPLHPSALVMSILHQLSHQIWALGWKVNWLTSESDEIVAHCLFRTKSLGGTLIFKWWQWAG